MHARREQHRGQRRPRRSARRAEPLGGHAAHQVDGQTAHPRAGAGAGTGARAPRRCAPRDRARANNPAADRPRRRRRQGGHQATGEAAGSARKISAPSRQDPKQACSSSSMASRANARRAPAGGARRRFFSTYPPSSSARYSSGKSVPAMHARMSSATAPRLRPAASARDVDLAERTFAFDHVGRVDGRTVATSRSGTRPRLGVSIIRSATSVGFSRTAGTPQTTTSKTFWS